MGNNIEVAVTNWTPTAYGTWGILLIQAVILVGIVARHGPKWLESWAAGRRMSAEDDRLNEDRRKEEENSLSMRVAALEDRLSRMGQAITLSMNASITTINALEALEPGHPAIRQGRELLGMAASALGDTDPFNKVLAQLATVRGVGE